MIENIEKYFSAEKIEEVLCLYDETHRFFHTRKHLEYILERVPEHITGERLDILHLVTLFHDCVYLPWNRDNEEKSVEYFEKFWVQNSKIQNDFVFEMVKFNILNTKTHEMINDFNPLDMWIVERETDVTTLLTYENEIFREFSFLPYDFYKNKRIEFLSKYLVKNPLLQYVISVVENRVL